MPRIRISTRIAVCLAMISTTAFVLAEPLGMFADKHEIAIHTRTTVCESLAIHCSHLVGQRNLAAIEKTITELAARNPDIRSAALRRGDGTILASAGRHDVYWHGTRDGTSTDTNIYVPIIENKKRWGALEVAFEPLRAEGWWGAIDRSFYGLIGLFIGVNLLLFASYLRRVLADLDPQKAVPERVRAALDTLVEGLLVLDQRGRIILANKAFSAISGRSTESLQGSRASDLPWKAHENSAVPPWEDALESKQDRTGVPLGLTDEENRQRSFVVNVSPILDNRGGNRGVLASFADVTQLENKKRELVGMVNVVEASRDKITRQNEELRQLAMRDPMTGCLNRRSFFEQFDTLWKSAKERGGVLCCVMADVDHFKSVNDNHGHAMGDEVLKKTATALMTTIGASGLVCRFGGEEFCVLLPDCKPEEAMEIAENLRQAVAALEFSALKVTASFGVSCNTFGGATPQELLDQADKSLYVSKRSGRNRVSRFDLLPFDSSTEPVNIERKRNAPQEFAMISVPFQAVTSLTAALSYRDPETAAHSLRVASLAVATARGLISASDTYVLEAAALLHDIGKIGVPDSILLKPEALTTEEWRLMQLKARIGVEIVDASFQSTKLAEIIRYYHCKFGGDPAAPQLPKGEAIPLGSRIIHICDAYDSMTSDRAYRKGRSPQEAFAELRRMAWKQFDPVLVERLIAVVLQTDRHRPHFDALPKETALQFGLQIERLLQAIDNNDAIAVKNSARRLATETDERIRGELQTSAEGLPGAAERESDPEALIQLAHDLVGVRLEAQSASLRVTGDLARAVELRKRLALSTAPKATTAATAL